MLDARLGWMSLRGRWNRGGKRPCRKCNQTSACSSSGSDERSSEKTAQTSDKRSSGLYEMVGETKRESGEKKAQTSDKHSSGLIGDVSGDVREAEVMGFNERNNPDECL